MKSLRIMKLPAVLDDNGLHQCNRLGCRMHETYDTEEYNKHPDEIVLNGTTYRKTALHCDLILYHEEKE